MIRMLCFTIALALATGVASADQYWVAYEGNDFPENEGWVRYASDPPAERWLEDGSLFIDSRADLGITENYGIYEEEGLDPGPGETFIMRWRLSVHEVTPYYDPGVCVSSDDLHSVLFLFDEGYVFSFYEQGVYAYFEPGVFHEFELCSADMRSYQLSIDGNLAFEGVFFESFFGPGVWFGDFTGSTSLAAWDYFRFGVIPEPAAWLMGVIALVVFRRRGP